MLLYRLINRAILLWPQLLANSATFLQYSVKEQPANCSVWRDSKTTSTDVCAISNCQLQPYSTLGLCLVTQHTHKIRESFAQISLHWDAQFIRICANVGGPHVVQIFWNLSLSRCWTNYMVTICCQLQTLSCLVQMASVRRSLFNNTERAKFLNQLVTGIKEILESPQVYYFYFWPMSQSLGMLSSCILASFNLLATTKMLTVMYYRIALF